jgi:pimeloyl-ACP methyl ester carboxylesterase
MTPGDQPAASILAHRLDGDGEPLVLLNGGLMTISSWEPIAERLSLDFRVVRCDFRGQLLSPGVPPPHLEAHVADTVALLDHLGVAAAHVVGTSFGGQVGLLLAARHPERVRSLVAATVVDYPPPEMVAADEALMAAAREGMGSGDGRPLLATIMPIVYSREFLELHGRELAARGEAFTGLPTEFFAGGESILRAINAMDLRPILGTVRCPTLVVAAELDGLMPAERTRAVADSIPGARWVQVPGSGHALVVEKQQEFTDIVLSFLARNRRESVVVSA